MVFIRIHYVKICAEIDSLMSATIAPTCSHSKVWVWEELKNISFANGKWCNSALIVIFCWQDFPASPPLIQLQPLCFSSGCWEIRSHDQFQPLTGMKADPPTWGCTFVFSCLIAFLQNSRMGCQSLGASVSSGWLNTTNTAPVWCCAWSNSCSAYLPVVSSCSVTWPAPPNHFQGGRAKPGQHPPPGQSQRSLHSAVILCLPSMRGNYIPLAPGVKSLSVLGWQAVSGRLEGAAQMTVVLNRKRVDRSAAAGEAETGAHSPPPWARVSTSEEGTQISSAAFLAADAGAALTLLMSHVHSSTQHSQYAASHWTYCDY